MGDFSRRGKLRRHGPAASIVRLLVSVGLAAALLASASCGRKFYRKSADEEVSNVLAEKNKYPAWALEPWHVYPDPVARFADPANPDRPPMPPDDPGTRDLAPNPQKPGKAGVNWTEGSAYLNLLAAWDAENRSRKQGSSSVEGTAAKDGAGQPSGQAGAPQKPADTSDKAGQPAAADSGQRASDYGQRTGDQPAAGGDGSSQPAAAGAGQQDYGLRIANPKAYLITLNQAVELGLINSREYQDRREDLYLLALPVTLERFAFAAQWFAVHETLRQLTGRDAPEGETSFWRFNSTFGFNKLFPTGALLLFQIANQTIVDLIHDGVRRPISESTLTVDLIQPLLRGGGKAVTLEPLTQVERNLVYGIRDYARFRKQFYVFIAGGGDIGRGAEQVIGRAALSQTPGFLAPTQGFLPALLINAQLANERENVVRLQQLLVLFRDFREGGQVGQLQIDQVEQQLRRSEISVSQTELNYRNSLDRLKLQLGVPPEIELDLEAGPLDPINRHFRRYETAQRQFTAATGAPAALEAQEQSVGMLAGLLSASPIFPHFAPLIAAARVNAAEVRPGLFVPPPGTTVSPIRQRVRQALTASELVEGTELQKRLKERWPAVEKRSDDELKEMLTGLFEQRRELLLLRTQRETKGQAPSPKDVQRLEAVEFNIDVIELEQLLRAYERRPWLKQTVPEKRLREYAVALQSLVTEVYGLLARARRERLDLLTRDWPEPPAIQVEGVDLLKGDLGEAQDVVARTALTYRLDLMNQRAFVVDAWRQIAVTANALLGVFNVRYHFDTFTPFGLAEPFNFGGSRFRHQLFFNFEAPFIRKLERNDYRAALIGLQRQRRAVMSAEDSALVGVREEIRRLRVLASNYTIQKRLVELAYLQVENALEEFSAPPPAAPRDPSSASANAAALTRQLLDAQNSLVGAQNQLYQIWINYLTTRLELYRDLELMQFDNRGVWIDEHANDSCGSSPDGRTPAAQRSAPGTKDDKRPEQLPAPRPIPDGAGAGRP